MTETIKECLQYFASIGDIELMKVVVQIKKEEEKTK